MSHIRPLCATAHRALRFDPEVVSSDHQLIQVGLSELSLVAADMPLCLAKDGDTGRFNIVALVGLTASIDLFVHERRFHATYCPRALQLRAFRLDADGVAGLAVDEMHPAISNGGEPLFTRPAEHDSGQWLPSPRLSGIATALKRVITDVEAARVMANSLATENLVRRLNLILRADDRHEHAVEGLYTIDGDALMRLPDEVVIRMHRSGTLGAATLLMSSLAQTERLCQLHNAGNRIRLSIARLSHGDPFPI